MENKSVFIHTVSSPYAIQVHASELVCFLIKCDLLLFTGLGIIKIKDLGLVVCESRERARL